MLEYLQKVNDFLEQVPLSVTKFFKQAFKAGEELVQEYVDAVCRWVAWQVNINIERVRQKVIRALWQQYSKYLVMLQAAQVIKKFLSDPIGTIFSFAEQYFKPYSKVIEFIKVLGNELPRLAKNLAEIARALPPEPPSPDINFNQFKIKVHTISMKEVLAGPDSIPPPEQMFPEPPKPWSKETFDSAFDNAKAVTRKDEIIYKLPESATNLVNTKIS